MAKQCQFCGKEVAAFTPLVRLADAQICIECWARAGFGHSMAELKTSGEYTLLMFKNIVAVRDENLALIAGSQLTKTAGNMDFYDGEHFFVVHNTREDFDLCFYEQVVGFELLEDGESIIRVGLGRAVAGGLLLGGLGAIVGSVTGHRKTSKICNSLQIKITLRHSSRQTVYLSLISKPTKTGSSAYKAAYLTAQEALSALQLAVDAVSNASAQPQRAPVASGADEILKYKQLLDAGIITEEEFAAKKKQLLGL